MQIDAVHCNAINGDGTLLFKVDMDEPKASYQYCFYVYRGSETVFKGTYDRKSWLEYKVEELGKYRIKAFVRDTESGEKISEVIPYVLKEKYAWKLAEALRKDPPPDGEIGISIEKLSPGVFRATADEQGGSYVWTVFREGEEKSEFERGPDEDPVLVYAVLANGYYHVELVAEVRGKLLKGVSQTVELKREELEGDKE